MTSDVQAFALTIHTVTNAFKPEPTVELVRILRDVADQIEAGREYGKSAPVHDINGNHVGSFMLVDELAQREAKSAAPPFDVDTGRLASRDRMARQLRASGASGVSAKHQRR